MSVRKTWRTQAVGGGRTQIHRSQAGAYREIALLREARLRQACDDQVIKVCVDEGHGWELFERVDLDAT